MTRRALWAAQLSLLSLCLAGCGASLPSMTTGSLFGGDAKPAAPQVNNDPTSRAMQVGSTSARAVKCGYNFDPAKLRAQFIASETAANPNDAARLTQIYDTSFNGITKAVAKQGEEYCSQKKTRQIKEALTRHLAGDYTPAPPEAVVEEDGGLLSGLSSPENKSPDFKPSTDNSNL